MRSLLCWLMCALACAAQSDRDSQSAKNPLAKDPKAVEAGKIRFVEACAECHGANAEGARGPNLAESDHVRQMSDGTLFRTVHNGIPAGGMPALPLPDNDIWEVVAFLRSLTTPAFFVPVQGDPEAGAEVYRRSKCGSCHMILGHGGFLGPDLTDLASSRTVKQLRQAVLNPGELTIDGFKGVTVVLRDGRRISGVAKNSSDYSMDVLDASGDLHLLETSDVRSTQFANKSLMPDNYSTTLSSAELNNLIAFLSRQAVRPDAKTGQKTAENAEGH